MTTNSLKIAVIGTRGFPDVQGGVESHCQHLYPLLAGRGCEVTVFGRRPYLKSNAPYLYKGVTVVPLWCPKNKFLEAFIHTFLGLLAAKRMKHDIVHVHAVGPALLIPLARVVGFKVVMTHHGPDYERKKWNVCAKMFLKIGEYAGCRWAHEIIAISEGIALQIEQKFNRQAAIIPNGVTVAKLSQTQHALRQYGLSRQRYILAVGRFVPEKGFHDLIEAFSHLALSRPGLRPGLEEGWKLVIVGKADHEDEYSKSLKAKASKDLNIVMTGFLSGEALQELYSHAGLFVLPSYYEGLPIAMLEAMSFGVSCIASDIMQLHTHLGLSSDRFFKTGDCKEMREKIEEFLSKPLSESQKSAQQETVKENFAWGTIADNTVKIYRKML